METNTNFNNKSLNDSLSFKEKGKNPLLINKFGWRSISYSFSKIIYGSNNYGFIVIVLKIFFWFLKFLDPFIYLKWTIESCVMINCDKNQLNKAFLLPNAINGYEKDRDQECYCNKNLKKWENHIVDSIVLIKLILAILIFHFRWYTNIIVFWYLVLSAISTFNSIPNNILNASGKSNTNSYIRATILGIINYIELVFHFASLYSIFDCLEYSDLCKVDDVLNNIDYLYFSFITVSTIGYGHLSICNNWGYIFVIMQVFIFLMFVLIFFNLNLSRINDE